jgi:hypothetical protein
MHLQFVTPIKLGLTARPTAPELLAARVAEPMGGQYVVAVAPEVAALPYAAEHFLVRVDHLMNGERAVRFERRVAPFNTQSAVG